MAKVKMVLFCLLGVMLIFPLVFARAPAVKAEGEEPQEDAGVTASLPPDLIGATDGWYYWKGKKTHYTMDGDKVLQYRTGWLHISCQDVNNLEVTAWYGVTTAVPGMGFPGATQQIEQTLLPGTEPQGGGCVVNGFVGNMIMNDQGKYKNKPRLFAWYSFFGYHSLEARVKLDSKTGEVKSIKGTFQGGSTFVGETYGGKFTAKPAVGPSP